MNLATAGLRVLAEGRWPERVDDTPPRPLAGFIQSSFSPLVAEAAERCLRQYFGDPPSSSVADRTAIVIASSSGDMATAIAVAGAVDGGRRVAPLLFFQSVPNAVAGYIAARWGLGGPVVCLGPADDQAAEAVDVAALLLRDGDADGALILLAEQATGDEPGDSALALLVAPITSPTPPPRSAERQGVSP